MHCLKFLVMALLFLQFSALASERTYVIGSKMFGENYLLSEILAQYMESKGYSVERKLGLGGTLITFEALKHKEIDIYPEYSGTFAKVILKNENLGSFKKVQAGAASKQLRFHEPIGFNNSYGFAVRKDVAEKYGLEKLSDLKGKPDLEVAFNFEFMNREDGWPKVKKVYGLDFDSIKTLEQTLAYQALASAKVDVIVVYTTDGKVQKYEMKVLEDDRGVFPEYQAAFLVQPDLPEDIHRLIMDFNGSIDESTMIALNARVDVDGEPYQEVATDYLIEKGMIDSSKSSEAPARWEAVGRKILWLTWEHIYLVLISTFAACIVGIPLGIMLFRYQRFADPILYIVGLLQTIPSLALLVYMIPLFGVSVQSALMALFLYSLLPILQNTYSGLQSVSPRLIHAAQGIGLFRNEVLLSVEMPLAAPIIIAGVRVAAVINVGTATIAAFIGSGGLGELIVQGLTLNDLGIMQQGAIPAALLAVVVNISFTWLEKRFQL